MKEAIFKSRIETGFPCLRKALREALRPMNSWFDPRYENLPFFGNGMTGEHIGNSHHDSFSMAHIPGRWLNALLNAEDVIGVSPEEGTVENLSKWAYRSLENSIGFPGCMSLDTMTPSLETDLHNLREVMHALTALVQFRQDAYARELALKLIGQVDRYFDYEKGCMKEAEWMEATGGTLQKWSETSLFDSPFPVTFGRYIGPLVKFYRATGEPAALRQALRLKDVCFRDVLNERGDYDVEVFGNHTHSTTAMISSLALLGWTVKDAGILTRVQRFMENGLKQIALDFGWCIEGYRRTDNVGEINNTADMIETCLILGAWGVPGYYARAERMLRAHLLPAQLLDTCFIPEFEDPSEAERYHLASRSRGAFGFPCPYGHEDRPGADISFNWDIVGGGSEGLCESIRAQVSRQDMFVSLNLLFDCETKEFTFESPYGRQGHAVLTSRCENPALRIRIPARCVIHVPDEMEYMESGEWLYLFGLQSGQAVELQFEFTSEVIEYPFRGGRCYTLRWEGEAVTGAKAPGKRLRFFDEIG